MPELIIGAELRFRANGPRGDQPSTARPGQGIATVSPPECDFVDFEADFYG